MGNRDFDRPIFFRNDEGHPETFRADNASDALIYMERFWSGARTREFKRAYAICESALKNLSSAESARGYVVAAAEQAGILDRPKMLAMARSARRQVA